MANKLKLIVVFGLFLSVVLVSAFCFHTQCSQLVERQYQLDLAHQQVVGIHSTSTDAARELEEAIEKLPFGDAENGVAQQRVASALQELVRNQESVESAIARETERIGHVAAEVNGTVANVGVALLIVAVPRSSLGSSCVSAGWLQ